ncbi:MAG TPA: Uma2 family endonuclease [Vicinamibacterales bacterium]|jgi:Uma2 family endonuclease|nr:Uma2 family endonuclease [Vicinamibacterales bacterium]
MTTAEYLETNETVLPRELAYGILRVADSPIVSHQRMVGSLYLEMTAFVRRAGLGEVLLAPMDVILDYDRALVVQPDLLFVSADRAAIVTDKVHGAPDVVVEVLSPQPRIGDLHERIEWFAKYGVRECWLADLEKQQFAVLVLGAHGVIERRLGTGGTHVPSDILPGVVLPYMLW